MPEIVRLIEPCRKVTVLGTSEARSDAGRARTPIETSDYEYLEEIGRCQITCVINRWYSDTSEKRYDLMRQRGDAQRHASPDGRQVDAPVQNPPDRPLRWMLWLGLLPPVDAITQLQSTARAAFPCEPILWIAALPVMPTLWTLGFGLREEHAREHANDEKGTYPQGNNATEQARVAISRCLRKPCAEPDDNANNQPDSKSPTRSFAPLTMCRLKARDDGAHSWIDVWHAHMPLT